MTTKSRIIFVDDELSILKSIRRELRSEKPEWQMDFYESPLEALTLIADNPPLIVVSDKRMESMDGIKFLQQVRDKSPETIRVLLTGDTSQDIAVELAALAHMLISKPYQHDDIMSVMYRAKSLEALPLNDSMKKQLGAITQLPVLPELYLELRNELADDDTSAQRVVEIIKKEPVIIAKLIQLANSPFLGFSSSCSSPLEAVMRLGLEMLSSLILTVGVFRETDTISPEKRKELLAESIQIAELCRQIAIEHGENQAVIDQAFLLGMLHNIGHLIPVELNVSLPSEASEELPHQEDVLGAYLLSLWEFEERFVYAVYYQNMGGQFSDSSPLIGYLHVAKTIIATQPSCRNANHLLSTIDQPLLNQIGILESIRTFITTHF